VEVPACQPPLGTPKPVLLPEFCKGCGRCIDSCAKHCIEPGSEIDPLTGLVPVTLNLEACNGCGLCMEACPEPYGLRPQEAPISSSRTRRSSSAAGRRSVRGRGDSAGSDPAPARLAARPEGNYASAIGALLAGCRHVFGYPITPSTEGAELMARLQPKLDGVSCSRERGRHREHDVRLWRRRPAVHDVHVVAGLQSHARGISYMIGAEVPGVFVNVMRGGPGLGNIAPEQADVSSCAAASATETRTRSSSPPRPRRRCST